MRIASLGHAVFAAAMIALGMLGLIKGDFASVWQPVPADFPTRQLLAYLCAAISLAAGVGLLMRQTEALAARVLLVYLLLWLLLLKVPDVFRAPAIEVSWLGVGEIAVILAGAWVLCAWFSPGGSNRYYAFVSGDKGLRNARLLFGLSLIPLGLAHLTYVNETAAMVPGWLPAHRIFAFATGCTYLAAGVAVLAGIRAPLAAVLCALQMGGFTLLVWVPHIAVGTRDGFQWSGTSISLALTAGAWVVADSYRKLAQPQAAA
ncbi:MAG TPA: hypothetical protein VF472_26200 [Burkholderiaceae bacterium]